MFKTMNILFKSNGSFLKICFTIKSRWSIVYIEGSQVMIKSEYNISFSEDRFCLSKHCYLDSSGLMDKIYHTVLP